MPTASTSVTVTASSTFSIGPDGGCVANVCGSTVAGAHTVTATSGAATGSTGLNVVAGSVSSLTLSPPVVEHRRRWKPDVHG